MGREVVRLKGFREPGHATRCQQREHAKLNVNHPANLPRIEMRRDEANKRNELRIIDDPKLHDVLTIGKLREAMKLMYPIVFVRRPIPMGEMIGPWPVRPNLQQIPRKVRRDTAEVRAMRQAADMARDTAMLSIAPPIVGTSWTTSDVNEAIEMATKAGQLCQALHGVFSAVPDFKDRMEYNYAKQQPHGAGVKDLMAIKGWQLAGGGYFSMVFTKGGLAIKVGLKSEDSAAAYAAFCRDNKGLKGLPQIFDMQHHGRNSHTVVMPKYVELNSAEKDALNNANRKEYKAIGPEVLRVMEMWGIRPACERIKQFFQGMATFDLHGENVMKDEHGNFIITDPVSFKAGAEPR